MKGITLIELSVALSIMAILAAMLLPRIAELQRATRVGELKYLHGMVSSRVLLAHMTLKLRQGRPDAQPCAGGAIADNRIDGPGTLCTEGGLIHMRHGYPASTPLGTPGVVSASGAAAPVFNPTETQLRAAHYRVRVEAGKTTFMRADADTPEHCAFTYSEAPDAKTAASISAPLVSGC